MAALGLQTVTATFHVGDACEVMGKAIWYCEKHDSIGTRGKVDTCVVFQLLECQWGRPAPCVLRRYYLVDGSQL